MCGGWVFTLVVCSRFFAWQLDVPPAQGSNIMCGGSVSALAVHSWCLVWASRVVTWPLAQGFNIMCGGWVFTLGVQSTFLLWVSGWAAGPA